MAFWDGSHHGSFHIYGHCHTNSEAKLDAFYPERRSIDVGVDNAALQLGNYQPFSKEDLIGILGGRKGHDPLDYYKYLSDHGISNTGGTLWPI
jgi:calcineurin-like phosphoesterase family protein